MRLTTAQNIQTDNRSSACKSAGASIAARGCDRRRDRPVPGTKSAIRSSLTEIEFRRARLPHDAAIEARRPRLDIERKVCVGRKFGACQLQIDRGANARRRHRDRSDVRAPASSFRSCSRARRAIVTRAMRRRARACNRPACLRHCRAADELRTVAEREEARQRRLHDDRIADDDIRRWRCRPRFRPGGGH